MEHSNAEMAEVLEKVADAWESGTLGWCQGRSFIYKNNPYGVTKANIAAACSVGGVMLEVGVAASRSDLRKAVIAALRDRLDAPNDLSSVSRWNDQPERTKQQVIDKFKEVAKDLRNANNEVL